MVIIFIILAVVIGIFAIWFNVWNHRDNKKKEQYPKIYDKSVIPEPTKEQKEQTQRILNQLNNKRSVLRSAV